MKREVCDCDGCSAKDITSVSLSLLVDRTLGPHGSRENDYELFDLCPSCVQAVFRKWKSRVKMSFEDARWLAEQIKEMRKTGTRPT